MRLTQRQIEIITETVSRIAGAKAQVFLFGSQLDDMARGGDVDILIETPYRLRRVEQARIKMELERMLGRPVDLLVHVQGATPTSFHKIAKAKSVRLEGSS